MEKEYPILTNRESVWLDIPDDAPIEVRWDIDIYTASLDLRRAMWKVPFVKHLIEQFNCNLVVETNMEYFPFLI